MVFPCEWGMDFPAMWFDSLAYLFPWLECSALGFHSSPSVQRECSLRSDRWLALVSVSLGRGKLHLSVIFLHGL